MSINSSNKNKIFEHVTMLRSACNNVKVTSINSSKKKIKCYVFKTVSRKKLMWIDKN
jgi:phosphopantothenoylcysteine synthetase/decarboxylase